MKVENLRSPYATVGILVYFGRMLDKIRLHARGKLPPDFHENLGAGFDGRCVRFLHVTYPALVERVQQGGSDEDILEWCFRTGRQPNDEEILVWNNFMQKRGWRDDAAETLAQRKQNAGIPHRTDILTFFDLLELDEGRI